MFSDVHLVVFSPTGTSQKTGEMFLRGCGTKQVTKIDLTVQEVENICIENMTLFVVPVYAGRVAPLAKKRLENIKGNKTPAVIIVVYGNRAYEDALVELQDLVEEAGFIPIAAAACLGEHSYSSAERPIAQGRPDMKDEEKIVAFAQALKDFPVDVQGNTLQLPGNKEYREGMGDIPFHPQRKDSCVLCTKCLTLCPLQMIGLDGDSLYWKKEMNCTMCCACIKSCPTESLYFDAAPFHEIAEMLYKNFSDRREPEFFTANEPRL